MKFSLLAHPSFRGANEMLYERLACVDPSDLSVKHIIIVPDRATLAVEKEMLTRFGGSFSLQVYTMRRFSALILPEFRYLDKQSAVLALTKIVCELDELTCFRGKPTYGFISDLYDVIGQLKYSRITPEKLKSKDLPYYLKGKVEDIAKIFTAYESFLARGYIDSADRLNALIEALPLSGLVANSCFYIKDFDNFSVQEREIISRLAMYGRSLTAAVTFCDKPSHTMLYLNDAYFALESIMKKLTDDGKIESCQIERVIEHEMGDREAFLFSGLLNADISKVTPRKLPSDTEIYSACSVTDEITALARYIGAGVAGGDRYNDYTVIVSDASRYSTAVKNIFTEYSIPFFIDSKLKLSEHTLARFFISYFHMYVDNFSLKSVISFVKNAFFECDEQDKFIFERYVKRYNQAHRFHTPFTIEEKNDYLTVAEGVRQRLVALATEDMPNEANAELYVEKAQRLIESEGLFDKASVFCEKQKKAGLAEDAGYTEQVPEKLARLFDLMKNTLSGLKMGVDLFVTLLEHTMSATEITILPLNNHCVEFIEMPKSRRHEYKKLCIIGANDGVFPMVKGDFGIFSDANLSTLAQAGIEIEPSVRTLNQRERFNVFQLFLENRDALRISYCTGESGESKPSLAVRHLLRMYVGENAPLQPKNHFGDNEIVLLNRLCAEHYLKQKVCSYADGHTASLSNVIDLYYALGCPSIDSLRREFSELKITRGKELFLKNGTMSVSRIETFYICPYRHYLQYGLRLKPTETDVKASDFGSIIHAVAEGFVCPYTVESFTESEQESARRAGEIFDNEIKKNGFYVALTARADMRAAFAQLKRECCTICGELRKQIIESDFKPKFLEMLFNEKRPIKIKTEYGDIRLKGVIDRVDINGNDAVIIDYKTGQAGFSYGELYSGKKLQLTVYARAVEEMGLRCVGLYYMRLRGGYIKKKDEKRFTLIGRTLEDKSIINKIDKGCFERGESKRLGFKLTAKREISKVFKGFASEKQMTDMKMYTEMLLKRAVKGFVDGIAEIKPLKNECEFCDYKTICDYGDLVKVEPKEATAKIEDISEAVKEAYDGI